MLISSVEADLHSVIREQRNKHSITVDALDVFTTSLCSCSPTAKTGWKNLLSTNDKVKRLLP